MSLPTPKFFLRSGESGLRIPLDAAGAADAAEKAAKLAAKEGRSFVLFSETKLAEVHPVSALPDRGEGSDLPF